MTSTKNNDAPSLTGETASRFTYHIREAPAFALPVEELELVGDAQDIERGVLLLRSMSCASRYPYLPVQAISLSFGDPDLVVDIVDGEQKLTTLHFCTIWRGMQRDRNSKTWERVSFPKLSQAFLYNAAVRLSLCSACHRLHKYYCVFACEQVFAHLTRALAEHGLAVCVSDSYVYVVTLNGERNVASRGLVSRYAVWPAGGWREVATFAFEEMPSCVQFLMERGVTPDVEWHACRAYPELQEDVTVPILP